MADEIQTQPDSPDDPLGGVGGALLDRIGRRAVLRTLQSALQRGLHVGDMGLAKAIATAEVILDDNDATHRDKLRASEFLKAVTDKGIEVALHSSKEEKVGVAGGASGTLRIIVERRSTHHLIPIGDDHPAALPQGPAIHEVPRATIQRGDVRETEREDDVR